MTHSQCLKFVLAMFTVIDFTWPGRLVCIFFCVLGIALYAIPVGTLFDSFGAVLGMDGGDDEEDGGDDEEDGADS